MEFFLSVSVNSVTKIYVIERVRTCHILVRDQDATTAPARHLYETGFLSPVHASMIYQIPRMTVVLHLGKTPLYFCILAGVLNLLLNEELSSGRRFFCHRGIQFFAEPFMVHWKTSDWRFLILSSALSMTKTAQTFEYNCPIHSSFLETLDIGIIGIFV